MKKLREFHFSAPTFDFPQPSQPKAYAAFLFRLTMLPPFRPSQRMSLAMQKSCWKKSETDQVTRSLQATFMQAHGLQCQK
jgi:hypothetical protein